MGQGVSKRTKVFWTALALSFSLSCKVEEQLLPTTPTAGSDSVSGTGTIGANTPPTTPTSSSGSSSLTAPIIADPLSGATVSESQPTLTVLNSARSGSEPPTYLYQVSPDSTFAVLAAQSPQVPEGTNGKTSWTVDRALSSGRYFWRVRARAGTTESSFSATAEFSVGATGATPPPTTPPPTPAPPPTAGTILSDPLTGSSVGDVSGGSLTSSGWVVRSPSDFIRYEVPTLERGWVEFDVAGLTPSNQSHSQFMLFGMWDPSAGDYRENRYRVNLQKLHPNPHNPPYLRVRWIANGEQHDRGSNFYAWEQHRTYRFRIEWGPGGGANQARVYLDGALMIEINYNRAYRPAVHWIELGIGERGESVVGARYSNFRVGQ
jgi:hypothetical protein